MPNLTITKNYADNTTLTQNQLDTAFGSVETFINTTKLDSTNIQSGGVSDANLASNSVTTSKIANDAVTTAKIADANVTTAKIADANVTTDKIADSNVTTGKLAANAVTAAKMANSTVTGTQVASNINLPGNAVQENGRNVVVSGTNATNSLAIVRGAISPAAAILSGEGFSVVKAGTGKYQIFYSNAFTDAAVITATPGTLGNFIAVTLFTSSAGQIEVSSSVGGAVDDYVYFTAVGQR